MNLKLFIIISFLFTIILSAQNDCTDAIVVCGNSGYNELSVEGAGNQELNGKITCDGAETNSVWFKLNIKTSGTLAFTLTPSSKDIKEDFDFYIFSNSTCDNLGMAIRCSTTNPHSSGQSNNLTGLKVSEIDTSEGPGSSGNSFLKPLDVQAGETYFLVIDRPIGKSNFKLSWEGTAKFYDEPTVEKTIKALDLKECGTIDETTAEFDLTKNNIVNTQSNVITTYHTTNNDAILNENPIDTARPFVNQSNPQTLYIRLTNTITGCFTIEDFTITAAKKNAAKPKDIIVCDDSNSGSDNDGISTFLLNTIDSEVLGSYDATDFNISYHITKSDAENMLNPIDKTAYKNMSAVQIIFIRFEENKTGCADVSQSFKLIVNPVPEINNTVVLRQCDDDTDGLSKFNLNEAKQLISIEYETLDFGFYRSRGDAVTNDTSKQISDIESYKNSRSKGESVWVSVSNSNTCSQISEVKLEVSATQIPTDFLLTYEKCDEPNANKNYDGITDFDLTDVKQSIKDLFTANQELLIAIYENEDDALAEKNEILELTSYKNKTKNTQMLYIRVDSEDENACIGLGKHIQLIINKPPSFEVESIQDICVNDPNLTLEVFSTKSYIYEWKKEDVILGTGKSLKVNNGGRYLITGTDPTTKCTITKQIVVNELFPPQISEENVVVDNRMDTVKLSIEIEGDNEFALYNEQNELIEGYKKEPSFTVSGGIYTIYVRNGCGVSALTIPILQFPKFLTPNNDGFNDTWVIKGLRSDYFIDGTIFIFDRFGKILYKQSVTKNSWDGTYNGILLPSNDYWYEVQLTRKNNKAIKEVGHFSLLRD